jgi:hypothetical protein
MLIVEVNKFEQNWMKNFVRCCLLTRLSVKNVRYYGRLKTHDTLCRILHTMAKTLGAVVAQW